MADKSVALKNELAKKLKRTGHHRGYRHQVLHVSVLLKVPWLPPSYLAFSWGCGGYQYGDVTLFLHCHYIGIALVLLLRWYCIDITLTLRWFYTAIIPQTLLLSVSERKTLKKSVIHPIPSNLIPSYLTPFHPIPFTLSNGRWGGSSWGRLSVRAIIFIGARQLELHWWRGECQGCYNNTIKLK